MRGTDGFLLSFSPGPPARSYGRTPHIHERTPASVQFKLLVISVTLRPSLG